MCQIHTLIPDSRALFIYRTIKVAAVYDVQCMDLANAKAVDPTMLCLTLHLLPYTLSVSFLFSFCSNFLLEVSSYIPSMNSNSQLGHIEQLTVSFRTPTHSHTPCALSSTDVQAGAFCLVTNCLCLIRSSLFSLNSLSVCHTSIRWPGPLQCCVKLHRLLLTIYLHPLFR